MRNKKDNKNKKAPQAEEIERISNSYSNVSKTADLATEQFDQLMITLRKSNKVEGETEGACNKLNKSLETF